MQSIVLDIDDASVLRTRYDLLKRLKEFYPNLKVSLFFIPYDYELEMSGFKVLWDQKLRELQSIKDWVEFIPHGLSHIDREFEKCDRTTMEIYVKYVEEEFKKIGIPMTKGFKAPQWLWNKDVVDVLDENEWFGASDRNQPDMLKTKKDYVYNYSIEEPFFLDTQKDILKLHGHMTLPDKNNIDSCFLNLMKMPRDSKFLFISEYLNA